MRIFSAQRNDAGGWHIVIEETMDRAVVISLPNDFDEALLMARVKQACDTLRDRKS